MILSIITVCYNNREGLLKTVQSVVTQTFHDYEWIVIDGGSNDGSIEIIRDFSDQITYWVSEPDNGIYNAMNKGVKYAKGDYLIFLNSGDSFASEDVVKNVTQYLTGDDYVFGKVNYIDESGVMTETDSWPFILPKGFWIARAICHQSMFIKRELLLKRPYDESLKIVADWENTFFHLEIGDCSYKIIDSVISNVSKGGYSDTHRKKLSKERNFVIEKYFSKKEADKLALSALSENVIPNSRLHMAVMAYEAYIDRRYNQNDFCEIFSSYKKTICTSGSFKIRLFNWMCVNHMMFILDFFRRIIS